MFANITPGSKGLLQTSVRIKDIGPNLPVRAARSKLKE